MSICSKKSENLTDTEDVKNKTLTETLETTTRTTRKTYEVSSIKNANLSIKFEGIKIQKCLIACKKGINVVVPFQYSEIS